MNRLHRASRGLGATLSAVGLGLWLSAPTAGLAQNMIDYTNYPIFLSQTVPPNILFLVDMGNFTLEAAYSGSGHHYPISFKSETPTVDKYASNVTLTSQSGPSLVAVKNDGTVINTTSGSPSSPVGSPADVFNSNKTYYGIFDPLRCYGTNANSFIFAAKKTTVADSCAASQWDGNFLDWLTMRKKEMIYQVLVGGQPIPAQANQDGTANSLAGEPKTGENGSTNSCNDNTKSCWRYVKFVPTVALAGRVPTTLPTEPVNISGDGTVSSGIFFGMGGGNIFVNDNATPNPFDNAPGMRWNIKVDLTTEPNVPAGTGTQDSCIVGDTNYAGANACYLKERSLGLFQKMRTDNMHVAIMFVNASTGQGGSLQFSYDQLFNASSVTQIRNEHIKANSPMAEALYEGLCLFRKSQGPCYSNSGSWSTGYSAGGIGAVGDPFYFASMQQMVRCAKCFVLMISPGIGVEDGDAPDLQQPFGNLFSGANIGIDFTQAPWNMTATEARQAGDRLDDVAYYGRLNDLRSDLPGRQNVFFYGVNAMGGARGATLLASAAKYGGFEDRNNNNAVDLTGTQTCTYPTGSNLGSGTSTSNPEWDLDKDCVPDTFFDASEGGDLEAQINAAIAAILKKAASGTSISVLASSSTGEGSLFQAFFYPTTYEGKNEIKWLGFVQGLFVDPFGNLREDRGASDGGPDGKLVYSDDNIVVTRVDDASGDVVVDRYADLNGDGVADSATPYETVSLKQMQGIWEAGKKLALRDISTTPRNLITWVDLDNDGVVDANEQMAFSGENATTLAPYLRASANGTYTAANIISFIHGAQIPGMRNREVTVDGSLRVWKLGDVVNSTPTIVGAPKERYDILYGDSGYRKFVARWANRRQMAYVGANDGMLHAFNAGYYHRGDDPSTAGVVERGWYTTNPTNNSGGIELGEEMWGFVPYHLLPQLVWFTQPDYTHVSYVDLKPKVTDVRIFMEEAACGGGTTPTAAGCIHPNGWGTILIAGMRYGGSCGSCAAVSGGNNGGPALHVVADFNGNGNTTDANDSRYFYSAYFVLDVTDPDASPTVLAVYSSPDLGLTTSYPTVARMNLDSDGTTSHTNAKWFMVFGSGMHGYDGRAAASARLFAVELGAPIGTAPVVTKLPVASWHSFMGDPITVDRDLDFRSDVIYVGRTINPVSSGIGYWTGKLYRLTLGACSAAPCTTATWGIASGGNRTPTEMLDQFQLNVGWRYLGPVVASPTVTLDDTGEVWVFFGTGRFLSTADKSTTTTQFLGGVKDSVMRPGGCVQTNSINCWVNNLLDVSSAEICVTCSSGINQVSGVGGVETYSALIALVKSKDGWVTTLPTPGERSIVPPTIIGGAVLFPTFIPTNDICVAAGHSNLYALFYQTGSAYTAPILGLEANGVSQRSVGIGEGLASAVAIQIGAAPTGVAGFFQTSGANIGRINPNAPLSAWSEYVSWVSERS
jgi:type IV pilus assembly protein PilY1